MSTAIGLIRSSQGMNGTAGVGDASDQDWLDECADMGAKRLDAYALHGEFYDGDHRTELTDRAREYLERSGVRFAENFCEPMVDMVAERMLVEGFEVSIDGDAESDAAADLSAWLADAWWSADRMDEAQNTTHTEALVKGDAFGIMGYANGADGRPGRPTFAFNAPERMKAVYADDDTSRMLYAVKTWDSSETGPANPQGRALTRMNVYFPERIERYFKLHSSQGRGGWSRWPDEDGAWPTPWIDAQGEPLGIPVVHFRPRNRGRAYGRSELVSVVPQQLLLNKQVIDLAAILDSQGWPQRWASGVDPTTTSLKIAPGEVWMTNAKDAKFGQFDTASLEPVLTAIEATISRMARRSGMPLHLLTGGDMPSGESMKAAESRLVARVKDRDTSFGNCWEDAARMAVRLAVLAGDLDGDPNALTIQTLWRSPESRDALNEAQTALAKQSLGVSKHTLLLEMGYDPVQEADRRMGEAAEAMAQAARFYDGGGDPDEDPLA